MNHRVYLNDRHHLSRCSVSLLLSVLATTEVHFDEIWRDCGYHHNLSGEYDSDAVISSVTTAFHEAEIKLDQFY
jgi:hypothetical protein